MKILTYTLGMVSTNCYLVYDEQSEKACIIDPAEYNSEVMAVISERELVVEYIILNHFYRRYKSGCAIPAYIE